MSDIPKDKQIIIKDEYGMEYVAMWNKVNESFVYANPQMDMYHGEYIDSYYESEHIQEEDIIAWREM